MSASLCINTFNTAFQAKATNIGKLQQSIVHFLRSYLTNFIKHEVLLAAEDVTNVEYANASKQVVDELGIGMATRLFLTENEDDVAGTQ